jgi:hypothetical protein
MPIIETLQHFDTALRETVPKLTNRLQPGLTITDIEAKTDSFSWKLPNDAYDLYQWHNGLSGQPGKLNLAEKLLRLKGKWHGEFSGQENEARLKLGERLIVAKFLPLDYALAGHRHLKLGRCLIDLLPVCILTDWSDGGGKAVAAQKPLSGGLKVARFLVAIRRSRLTPMLISQLAVVNSQLGVVNIVDNKLHSTFSFEFTGDSIRSIFAVVNPEKLGTVKKKK